jgi:hypothetical protein
VRNLVWILLISPALAHAQERTVAITVDDLPYVSAGGPDTPSIAESANRKFVIGVSRPPCSGDGFRYPKNK